MDSEFGAVGVLFMFLAVGIFLIPVLFYLNTLKSLLLVCEPDNRRLNPDSVWLELIPLFGMFYQFIVVSRIADSIDNEVNFADPLTKINNGRGVGIAAGVLFILSMIPGVGIISRPIGAILWISHWVIVSKAKKNIVMTQGKRIQAKADASLTQA